MSSVGRRGFDLVGFAAFGLRAAGPVPVAASAADAAFVAADFAVAFVEVLLPDFDFVVVFSVGGSTATSIGSALRARRPRAGP